MGRSVTWTATSVPSARRRRILVVPRSVINASKVDTKMRSKKHRARTVCQDDSTTSLAAVLTVSCALRVSIVQVVQAVRAVRWMPPNACLANQVVIKAILDKLRVFLACLASTSVLIELTVRNVLLQRTKTKLLSPVVNLVQQVASRR